MELPLPVFDDYETLFQMLLIFIRGEWQNGTAVCSCVGREHGISDKVLIPLFCPDYHGRQLHRISPATDSETTRPQGV
jgi:hypothetical protein